MSTRPRRASSGAWRRRREASAPPACSRRTGGRSGRLAAQLWCGDAVRFLGFREDVPGLLAQAECALLASDYEGCPLAVVEALAAGVPVAATDAGGVRELVRPGQTGAVAPPDAAALTAALEDMLADPARAAEMGAAARREAASRLSLEAMTRSLVTLYDDLRS